MGRGLISSSHSGAEVGGNALKTKEEEGEEGVEEEERLATNQVSSVRDAGAVIFCTLLRLYTFIKTLLHEDMCISSITPTREVIS